MADFFALILATAFTSNILLVRFLGVCPLLACSKRMDTAFGLAMAMVTVITVTTALNGLIDRWVLTPLGLGHLRLLIFIAVIAMFVQLMEIVFERFFTALYYALGIFLPLITVNCAVLGTSLFMARGHMTFLQTVGYGLGSGIGWALAIVLMAGLRERVVEEHVPAAFRGVPLAMILIGLLAMICRGFVNLGLAQ